MTDAKRLLSEAHPPPPWIRPWAALNVHGIGEDEVLQKQANLDLAVYAVNHLPDYLAAVEVLEGLTNEAARAVTEPRRFHENEDERQQALGRVIAVARAALARLRDEVPA